MRLGLQLGLFCPLVSTFLAKLRSAELGSEGQSALEEVLGGVGADQIAVCFATSRRLGPEFAQTVSSGESANARHSRLRRQRAKGVSAAAAEAQGPDEGHFAVPFCRGLPPLREKTLSGGKSRAGGAAEAFRPRAGAQARTGVGAAKRRKEFFAKTGLEFQWSWKEERGSFVDPENVVQSLLNPFYLFYSRARAKAPFEEHLRETRDFCRVRAGAFRQLLLNRPDFNPLRRTLTRAALLPQAGRAPLLRVPCAQEKTLDFGP